MGGGGGQQGGGDIMAAMTRMFGGAQGPQVGVGSPIGGVDIPPANMNDPFGGIRGEMQPGDFNTSPFGLASIGGFGKNPSSGQGAFGPTIDPTWWINYGGVGN